MYDEADFEPEWRTKLRAWLHILLGIHWWSNWTYGTIVKRRTCRICNDEQVRDRSMWVAFDDLDEDE